MAGPEPPHAPSDAPRPSRAPSPPPLRGVPAERRRAIVVGASSGMGAALVRRLVRDGYRVAALARRGALLDELAASCAEDAARTGGAVWTRVHDVRDVAAVPALFEELVRALGGLELLVFAAGIMPEVGEREYDTEKDLRILAVNTGGCIAWCNPAAELFATQREGTIVGISSVAGDRGRKGNPVYCTSKAAMNTYLEALRNRLGTYAVHVCTVRPGYVDTEMTKDIEGSAVMPVIPVDDAARQILSAARRRVNVAYVPARWRWIMLVIRLIPSFVFRRLNV